MRLWISPSVAERARRVTAALALVVGASALASSSACGTTSVTPATEVIVHVRVDAEVYASTSTLTIVVDGSPDGLTFDRLAHLGNRRAVPPPGDEVRVALTPLDGDPNRLYRVTVSAFSASSGATPVVVARVISGYRAGLTLEYELLLVGSCANATCDDTQTCHANRWCDPARVDPGALPEVRDAGADFGPPPDLGPRCSPRPTGNPAWAQYLLPGTLEHPQSYQASVDTVVDCVTGLEWERAANPPLPTHAAAVAHCEDSTTAGYDDWRLPTAIELLTLVDYAVESPAPTIDLAAFPGTPAQPYWCALAAGAPSELWHVDFGTGEVNREPVVGDAGARCVR